MNREILNAIWKHGPSSPTDRFVLVALADYVNGPGQWVYPAQVRLVERTGYSLRTVKRSLDSLAAAGFITVRPKYAGGRRLSTSYRINAERFAPHGVCESPSSNGVTKSPSDSVARSPLDGDPLSVNGDTATPSMDTVTPSDGVTGSAKSSISKSSIKNRPGESAKWGGAAAASTPEYFAAAAPPHTPALSEQARENLKIFRKHGAGENSRVLEACERYRPDVIELAFRYAYSKPGVINHVGFALKCLEDDFSTAGVGARPDLEHQIPAEYADVVQR